MRIKYVSCIQNIYKINVTISKRTVWFFMSECIPDSQLAFLGLSL